MCLLIICLPEASYASTQNLYACVHEKCMKDPFRRSRWEIALFKFEMYIVTVKNFLGLQFKIQLWQILLSVRVACAFFMQFNSTSTRECSEINWFDF